MSNLIPEQRGELNQIIDAVERALQNTEHTPFTPRAFSRLKEKISEYVVQLISESVKHSTRRQSEVVSTQNVERAAEYLIANTSHKIYAHLSTIGGIFLGVAISTISTMVETKVPTVRGAVMTAVFGILGGGFIAAHIVRDLKE